MHKNDIIYIEKPESNNSDFITEVEILVDSFAIKDINPNLQIPKNHIRSQNLVLRNAVVNVCYHHNNVALNTKAIALQSGQYGATIELKM